MGAEQSVNKNSNGLSQAQILKSNQEIVKKFSKDAPQHHYAKLSLKKPQLLPQVKDSLIKYKNQSNISGQTYGSKLPIYQIIQKKNYYQGQWKDGLQNGKGVSLSFDGAYRQTYFKNGKAEGSGINIFSDGSYYSGQFKDDLFNGQGKFYYRSNRMTYQGQWKNGKPHGKGKQTIPQVGIYQGEFQNGLKNGKGKMIWVDGRQYEGYFYIGYMHGYGILKKDNQIFQGEFNSNRKIKGKINTSNGEYEGYFQDGQMSGLGKFSWKNGNIYQGQFKDNKMHGRGTMKLKNNKFYSGEWQYGNMVLIHQLLRFNELYTL